jgi:hypothetical protein
MSLDSLICLMSRWRRSLDSSGGCGDFMFLGYGSIFLVSMLVIWLLFGPFGFYRSLTCIRCRRDGLMVVNMLLASGTSIDSM